MNKVLIGSLMMAFIGLAGCAPKLPDAAAVLEDAQSHYGAVADPKFNVPAVPVAEVPPEMLRQEVIYKTTQAPGTIIIDPSAKHLYLITAKDRALRYGIAVGKAGFGWSGEAVITGRTTWPRWTPPPEMIARHPELARYRGGQPGGLTNPLGARALYLKTNGVDYGYRIHGTPEWRSIGSNASSGCIRMINQDVMDLYTRVPDGTHVIVLNEDGSFPTKLTVPKPAPKRKKAHATPVTPVVTPVAPATATVVAPTVAPAAPAVVAPAVPAAPAVAPTVTAPSPEAAPVATPTPAAMPEAAPLVPPAPAQTTAPATAPAAAPVTPPAEAASPAPSGDTPAVVPLLIPSQ